MPPHSPVIPKGRHLVYNANNELCITVVDPVTRKLLIPLNSTFDTRAQQRPTLPSLCLLFLRNKCRQGMNCYQVHATLEAVEALRRSVDSLPRCCVLHGDSDRAGVQLCPEEYWRTRADGSDSNKLSHSLQHVVLYLPGLNRSSHRLLVDIPKSDLLVEGLKSGDTEASAGGGSTGLLTGIPLTLISHTVALQKLLDEQTPLHQDRSLILDGTGCTVCRLHATDRCRYAEECKFLHLCKELTSAKPSLTDEHPTVIPIDPNAATGTRKKPSLTVNSNRVDEGKNVRRPGTNSVFTKASQQEGIPLTRGHYPSGALSNHMGTLEDKWHNVLVYLPGVAPGSHPQLVEATKGGLGAIPGVPLSLFAMTAGLQCLLIQSEQCAVLDGTDSSGPLVVDASGCTVCRLYTSDGCRYEEACKFLHLNRELIMANPGLFNGTCTPMYRQPPSWGEEAARCFPPNHRRGAKLQQSAPTYFPVPMTEVHTPWLPPHMSIQSTPAHAPSGPIVHTTTSTQPLLVPQGVSSMATAITPTSAFPNYARQPMFTRQDTPVQHIHMDNGTYSQTNSCSLSTTTQCSNTRLFLESVGYSPIGLYNVTSSPSSGSYTVNGSRHDRKSTSGADSTSNYSTPRGTPFYHTKTLAFGNGGNTAIPRTPSSTQLQSVPIPHQDRISKPRLWQHDPYGNTRREVE